MQEPASAAPDSQDPRPSSRAEKEHFSSFGRRHVIVLRGKWGLAVDLAFTRLTGYSLMTKQYSIAGRLPYQSSLILTTIGARSGQRRHAVLPYFKIGEEYVVKGSNGGGATDPHWVHNIRANSQAWIRVGYRSWPVRGRVAKGEERERLFESLSEERASLARYQEQCYPRELPLVVLAPWTPAA